MKYKYNGQWLDLSIKALDSMPIGTIILFAGETIPNGWLVCDGRTLYDEEYPDLHNVLGGTGLSFNLPNFKGRVAVGYDSTDTNFNAIGKTGGSKSLPEHSHFIDGNFLKANHSGSGDYYTAENQRFLLAGNRADNTSEGTGSQGFIANSNLQSRVGTTTAGTGNSGNLQPYLTVNYIIKALNTTPTMASVVNQTNSSTEDTYSCKYSNEHYGGVVLYENTSGSNSTITLSDDAFNYSRIDIIYSSNGSDYGFMVMTTYPNVSNKWSMIWNWQESNWGGILGQKITYTTTGTTYKITRGTTYYVGGNYQGWSNLWSSYDNGIKIYKVIGYK